MEGVKTCKVNGETMPQGIVIEGHQGHYATWHLVNLALHYGWKDKQAADYADSYDALHGTVEFSETWFDIVEEAQVYLNDVTEGATWYWWHGEVFCDDGTYPLYY